MGGHLAGSRSTHYAPGAGQECDRRAHSSPPSAPPHRIAETRRGFYATAPGVAAVPMPGASDTEKATAADAELAAAASDTETAAMPDVDSVATVSAAVALAAVEQQSRSSLSWTVLFSLAGGGGVGAGRMGYPRWVHPKRDRGAPHLADSGGENGRQTATRRVMGP